MITITDGKEKFVIESQQLWKRKSYFRGLATKLKYDYWGIELLFVKRGFNTYKKIIKCFPDGDNILKSYKNLDKNRKNTILLSNSDYREVKTIFDNMNGDKDYKKEAMIEVGAMLLSYEYYQNYILELDSEDSIDSLFDTYLKMNNYNYERYKVEIYARTFEILKEKYDVDIKENL